MEPSPARTQKALEKELRRIQGELGLGLGLRVVWRPQKDGNLSGEVKGDVIYVYETSREKALRTLRHELLDHAISKVIRPLIDTINVFIKSREAEAYRAKEELVEKLCRLL